MIIDTPVRVTIDRVGPRVHLGLHCQEGNDNVSLCAILSREDAVTVAAALTRCAELLKEEPT